jgi:chorismate mutase
MQSMLVRRPDRPVIIAGPCSAESESQVRETVERLAPLGIDMLRAGVWKPRTRPGSFEGHGAEALKWLVQAARPHGIPVCVEVAGTEHVELALGAGITAVWIGARTTVNPFMVQEIAEALRGTGTPVLVKNPVNPDVDLWTGALERLQKVGLTQLAAVHRGFSTYRGTPYRNSPNWAVPIELRRRMPTLPIYCDPSHICGNRTLLAEVSQRAIDLDLDGLMVEVHPDPDHALSDPKQQITPEHMAAMLAGLVWRRPTAQDLNVALSLEELRANIDRIDHEILDRLAERMETVRHIGRFKKEHSITILQHERWNEILNDRAAYADRKDMTQRFVRDLLDAIHAESIHQQTLIMDGRTLDTDQT